MNIKIRPETDKDYSKITQINDLAFGQKNEGLLVEKLRMTENFIPALSLVAEFENEIIGHILFHPITINSNENKYNSLSLAPMSVIPQYQNKGIGSKLVIKGLDSAKKLNYKSVIVLGHPEYYPKFGFKNVKENLFKVKFKNHSSEYTARKLNLNSEDDFLILENTN